MTDEEFQDQAAMHALAALIQAVATAGDPTKVMGLPSKAVPATYAKLAFAYAGALLNERKSVLSRSPKS